MTESEVLELSIKLSEVFDLNNNRVLRVIQDYMKELELDYVTKMEEKENKMKNKFIILSLTEGQWYTGYEDEEFLFDGDVSKAIQFDSYPEAETALESFVGGIYQIDKIFIVE